MNEVLSKPLPKSLKGNDCLVRRSRGESDECEVCIFVGSNVGRVSIRILFFYLEQEGRIKREHYKPVRAGSWVLVLGSLYGFIKSLSPEEGEG